MILHDDDWTAYVYRRQSQISTALNCKSCYCNLSTYALHSTAFSRGKSTIIAWVCRHSDSCVQVVILSPTATPEVDPTLRGGIPTALSPVMRPKYIVKVGDTLETIALRQLRDRHLALLIFNINKRLIPLEVVDAKSVPKLKQGMAIYLPTPADVQLFRSNLARGERPDSGIVPGNKTVKADAVGALVANPQRRALIESLFAEVTNRAQKNVRLSYTVRLGDTLRSIAVRHPSLKDVAFWKLLAEVNNLSTALDERGLPIAQIARGTVLILPTRQEIEAFKGRESRMLEAATGSKSTQNEEFIAGQVLKSLLAGIR